MVVRAFTGLSGGYFDGGIREMKEVLCAYKHDSVSHLTSSVDELARDYTHNSIGLLPFETIAG